MDTLSIWLMWITVIAAAVASPFIAMFALFLFGELLWDAIDAIGPAAALTLCIGVVAGLLLGRVRSRPIQPLPT